MRATRRGFFGLVAAPFLTALLPTRPSDAQIYKEGFASLLNVLSFPRSEAVDLAQNLQLFDIHLHHYLDGRKVAEITMPHLKFAAKRHGTRRSEDGK